MIGFSTTGTERPSSQLDDVLRRQFLDRLADVQVACWGAEGNALEVNGYASDATGPSDIFDPILSATPESVLLGLANQLNGIAEAPLSTATAMPILSDDHFATWDKLDKNRELLGVAKSMTLTSQHRARRAMMSAGLVGCGVAVSVAAIVWLVWSSLEGQAATSKPAEPNKHIKKSNNALVETPIQIQPTRSSIQPIRDEKPVGTTIVSSLTASALAGRFAQPKTAPSDISLQHKRQYLSLLTHIEVNEQGEAPLNLKLHDPMRDLVDAYVVLGNVPSGIVPTVGGPARDGQWRILITQLSELNLVLGTAPPNTFDLSVAIHAEAGQVLSEIGMTVVLKYPQRPPTEKTDRSTEVTSVLRPKISAEPPSPKPVKTENKSNTNALPERKASATKTAPSKTDTSDEDAPRPKMPMRPKTRQIEALDTTKQMGVGVEVSRSPPKRVAPTSNNTASGETWWKKPLPDWSRGTGTSY
ncbi:MAG: hypothetical protein ABL898_11405 [Hyphomicrobiaceae bacterium]